MKKLSVKKKLAIAISVVVLIVYLFCIPIVHTLRWYRMSVDENGETKLIEFFHNTKYYIRQKLSKVYVKYDGPTPKSGNETPIRLIVCAPSISNDPLGRLGEDYEFDIYPGQTIVFDISEELKFYRWLKFMIQCDDSEVKFVRLTTWGTY